MLLDVLQDRVKAVEHDWLICCSGKRSKAGRSRAQPSIKSRVSGASLRKTAVFIGSP